MLLRDYLEPARLGELDVGTGRLAPAAPAARPDEACGYFMQLGHALVALYATEGRLQLQLGDDVVPLERATAALEGENLRTLRILREGEEVARLVYPNPVHPFPEWDLSLAEEEDFDLGLYVANVVGSPERQRWLREKWRGGAGVG